MRLLVVAAALAALLAVAAAAAPRHVLFEMERSHVSAAKWNHLGRSEVKGNVPLSFAVKQRNMKVLEDILMRVSDPASPDYGNHLTLQEVRDLTGDEEAALRILHWLTAHGVDAGAIRVLPGFDYVNVELPMEQAERVLQAEYHEFEHSETKKRVHRVFSYSLPAHIADSVDFVAYTTHLPTHKGMRVTSPRLRSDATKGDDGTVSPQLIFSTYGIDTPSVTNSGSTQSLFESLGQDFSQTDLKTYCNEFNIPEQQIKTIIGPNKPTNCPKNPDDCGEANLDVQVILAIAQNSPTTYWSMPGTDQEPFLQWIQDVGNSANPPLVHSVSYGDVEGQGDADEIFRFCQEVMKLGSRGLTVMVASGDDGVANFPARTDPSQCGFFPAFPASCPYIVSVGGTMGPESGQPEVACTSNNGGLITTGGGFSNMFDQPSYQASAVQGFFNQGNLPPSNMWNSTGRGYPDVAVLAHNYAVVIGGQTLIESGTSAASPAFAGMITLINDARLSAGSSALGFINPALYSAPSSIFNDITSGENNCAAGESNPVCCQYGFTAVSGWDAVTGLGSVNFQSLLSYLESI